MNAARNLTGLVGAGRDDIPERTVTAAPPRGRSPQRDAPVAEPPAADRDDESARTAHVLRRRPVRQDSAGTRRDRATTARPSTVRISVNLPLSCKQWLTSQAREQQRFVSEIVMDALDRFGDEATPPCGRAKRVAVPDGTICNIVLPAQDRQRLDDLAAKKNTTRSALLTEVLVAARTP
jgi:hypothetical protein